MDQRIEGRRAQVTAGLVWSVVEGALPSGHQVRLRRERLAVFAPAIDEAAVKGTPSRRADG